MAAVARGIDMFDCVLPTRNARNGHLFTHQGVVRIRNSVHAEGYCTSRSLYVTVIRAKLQSRLSAPPVAVQ